MSGRYLLRTQLRRSRGETVYREWVNRSMPGWLCTTRFWLPCRMYNRANHFEYANVSLTANSTALLGTIEGGLFSQMLPSSGIPPERAVIVVALWTLFGVALAWWALAYREP